MSTYIVAGGSSASACLDGSSGAVLGTTTYQIIAADPNGKYALAWSTTDYYLRLLSLPTLAVLATGTVASAAQGWGAVFTPNGEYVIAYDGYSGVTYCYDTATFTQQGSASASVLGAWPYPLSVSADSAYYAGMSATGLEVLSIPTLSAISGSGAATQFFGQSQLLAWLTATTGVMSGGQPFSVSGGSLSLSSDYLATSNYMPLGYTAIWADATTGTAYGDGWGTRTHLSTTYIYQGYVYGPYPPTSAGESASSILTFNNDTTSQDGIASVADSVNHGIVTADQTKGIVARFNAATATVTQVTLANSNVLAIDPTCTTIYVANGTALYSGPASLSSTPASFATLSFLPSALFVTAVPASTFVASPVAVYSQAVNRASRY